MGLEIRDIQYFPDGRSVVDTMGGRRFKVVERGTKDGYATATVEFLHDVVPQGQELVDLQQLHDRTRALAVSWFERTVADVKAGILSHYGIMPPLEQDYWSSSSGPAWSWWILAILPLDTKAQLHILSQTLLKKRLEAISRILEFEKSQQLLTSPLYPFTLGQPAFMASLITSSSSLTSSSFSSSLRIL